MVITNIEEITNAFPHTAITSWSGFIYQGKVAVYHVLKLILVDRDLCSNYTLQLDSLEDFAILDATSNIMSIHQVKAKKAQSYSSYSTAIEQVKTKATDYKCTEAYFHTAQEITNKTIDEIESAHTPVKIYKYDGQSACHTDQIDEKIEETIKLILKDYPLKITDNYTVNTRRYLDQLITKKILKIHRLIHNNQEIETKAAYTQVIPFSDFLEIIDCDLNQKDLEEDRYYFFMLVNDIHRYYQDYCIENADNMNETYAIKLSGYMNEICSLGNNAIATFIRNITPHRKTAFKTLSDYKDRTFSRDEFCNAFLTILKELKGTKLNSQNLINWTNGSRHFLSTVINNGPRQAPKICVDIINNAKDTDLEVLFENQTLITLEIDVDSIARMASSITHGEFKHDLGDDENHQEENHITNLSKTALISLDNAVSIINDRAN